MLKRKVILFTVVAILSSSLPGRVDGDSGVPTRYLAFQVFTSGSTPPTLSSPTSKSDVKQLVQDIIAQIGSTGDSHTKLAFVIGPLAFDYSDAQLQQLIQDAFDIALELHVAVGFHIDDSMFWDQRADLWRDPHNVEWLDWDGTPNTGRRIDWGPQPTKLAPQMCFNSPTIQAEVHRLATHVIGAAIEKGVRTLEAQGHPELFAGVIVGWETQIGVDFDTQHLLGYCALTNLGFSRTNPPQDLDAERESVVQSFIELWAAGIKEAGIDTAKIYSHTAVVSHTTFDQTQANGLTYSQANHFASPDVSFGADYQPGFSTYPQPGLMEQLYDAFQKHGNPSWASAEGSTVVPSALDSTVQTETYLAWMFNHGATLVNIFGWGVGDQGDNPFWKAADNPDAISTYQKFLSGQALVADTTDMSDTISGELPARIHKIQAELPAWLQNHPDQQAAMNDLLQQLDQAIKAGRLQDAQTIVASIERLMKS